MRITGIVIVVWLLIGVLAAAQRDYFKDSKDSCSEVSDTALTVAAGPLNYIGLNPKVDCKTPQPSK